MKLSACLRTFAVAALCLVVPLAARAENAPEPAKLSPGLEKLTAKDTPLKKDMKIAFFGDSVTMQGGYITTIRAALKNSPNTRDLNVKLLQHGLNGGRVPTVLEGKSPWGDLGGTMESLLEKEKPNAVVIYLGINDVWHGAKGTTKPDFEAGLAKMVALCKKINATVVLCTPTIIGEEVENNKLNDQLDEYSDIVRALAKQGKLTLCELHNAFLDELKKVNTENKHKGNLTYDGVHMNKDGNALLADRISLALVTALKRQGDHP